MIGSREYYYPADFIQAAVRDMKEMQNGKKNPFWRSPAGKICFSVKQYRQKWEFQIAVAERGENCCRVDIAIPGDVRNKERKIKGEFALLDAMIDANTQIGLMAPDRND